jgi:hypothetical protein
MAKKQLPFNKDLYFQILDSKLAQPITQTPTGGSLIDKLMQLQPVNPVANTVRN